MYSDRSGDSGTTESTATTGATGAAGPGGGYDMGSAPVNTDAVMRREGAEVADIVARARGRADGFDYGVDRAIGSRPNWAANESERLYAFGTVNNEPGTAEELGQTWGRHGGELTRIADDLYNAISELGSAWIGEGAGAAQGSLVGIANSSAQASEAARTMQDRLAQQAAAASKLKSMPEPKEFDPGAETAAMLSGGPAAMIKDLKEQHDASQEVKAQQIAFLEAYTEELAQIDGTTPSFGPESLGLKPLDGGASVEAGRLGAMGTFGVSGTGMGSVAPGAGAPAVVAGGTDAVAGGTDGAQGARPHSVSAAAGTAAGAGSGSAPAPAAGGGGGLNVGQSLGAAAAGGALGYAGARSLSSGKRSGSKKSTEGAETVASANETGSAAAAPTNAAPVQNQAPVSSPGGVVGGGQPAPAGGPMGMGAGAAAGRQQEEEKEHTHASFLIEPDPDATFGATESAAPPVLGAWGPDDEGR
ncbi:hypothetical protein [Saccharomonospora piscinae]|uniref:WXG100 family type VII secretion target n=1 Tax=Saccharomonospora piscinae TaxID=687388 RepID=UPI000465B85B